MQEIKLSKGMVALVDDRDFGYLSQWKWYYKKNPERKTGYAQRNRRSYEDKCTPMLMHRVILGTPKGKETDHTDGNGCNNQRKNLRVCNRSQNRANIDAKKNSTSGYKGVRWHVSSKKWEARIRVNKKENYIGCFCIKEEAALAY